ncbi:MAG: hypothetical protein IMZ70_01945, partial [Candidatus Atribacteria bacterium]|nr:hypothetical protein [Candidatus Atribacteria bacterium]
DVLWLAEPAETFYPYTVPGNPVFFDYATCLNALDHMKEPAKAIENIAKYVQDEFLLITDLRTLEQLDTYHRLAVSEEDVLSWLKPYFEIIVKQNFPHQAGNPVRQLVVRCRKYS